MSAETVARPYALALFRVAKSQNKLDKWQNVLEVLAFMSKNLKVVDLIKASTLSAADKVVFIKKILGDNYFSDIENYLNMLITRKRFEVSGAILKRFIDLSKHDLGLQDATVYSAYPLNEEQIKEVKSLLEKKLNVKLDIDCKVDSTLVGGVKTFVGDLVIDWSIKGRLNKVTNKLLSH